MICWLIGHKIANNKCLRCGKTICEIKEHEWVYSEPHHYNNIGSRCTVRRCNICGIVEFCDYIITNSGIDEYPKWIRIK